ncbi:MAG: hypothetical protein PVH07_00735, partial [Chloroflexota bacterium]
AQGERYEAESLWSDDETVTMISIGNPEVVGMENDDFCRTMAYLLHGLSDEPFAPNSEAIDFCAEALAGPLASQANVPEAWLPLLGGSASAAASQAGPHKLAGAFVLVDNDTTFKKGKVCRGRGGYDDIRGGMPVTVRDADGMLLGVGSLEPGERQSRHKCYFFFQVEDLPEADFYEITMGSRGKLAYSFAELEDRDWIVTVSIGD